MQRILLILVLMSVAACDDTTDHPNLNNTSNTNNLNNTNNTNNSNQPDFVPVDYGHLFPEPFLSQEVAWEPCRLDDRDESSQAECADLVVPVHWDEPEGEVTTVHLKRLAGITSPRRRLFLLQGGPGGSSTIDFPPSMMEMHLADFSLDIIAVDHRGTGYSDYLLCPDQMTTGSEAGLYVTGEELFSCAEGEIASRQHYYSGFTISNAARDVALAVELLKQPESDSFVYGVSYGSTWGHRYAQLFPNQSRSVILDSLAIAGYIYLDDYDANAHVVAQTLLTRCGGDDLCSSKLGADPLSRAEAIMAQVRDGHCAQAGDHSLWQYLIFYVGQMWEGRVFIPAILYRLERCSSDDVAALTHLVNVVLGGGAKKRSLKKDYDALPLDVRSFNQPLFANIALSELLHPEPYEQSFVEERTQTLFASKGLDLLATRLRHVWPLYDTDETLGGLSTEQGNMLLLNGTLDFQTPIEVAHIAGEALEGGGRHFVVIPDANHGALWASPVKSPGALACGLQIFFAHLNAPEQSPDTTCLGDLKEVTFKGDPAYVSYFFGTGDLWENSAVKAVVSLSEHDLKRILREIRRSTHLVY